MDKPFDQTPAPLQTVEEYRRARADFMNYVRRAAEAERRLAALEQAAKTVCTAVFSRQSHPAQLYQAIRELAGLINFDGRKDN